MMRELTDVEKMELDVVSTSKGKYMYVCDKCKIDFAATPEEIKKEGSICGMCSFKE